MMKNFIFYNLFLSLVFFTPFSKKTQAHNESTENHQLKWKTCFEDTEGDCVEVNLAQVESTFYFPSGEDSHLVLIKLRSSTIVCPIRKLQDGRKCLSLKPPLERGNGGNGGNGNRKEI